MGYSNGSNAIAKTPDTRQKRPPAIGFSLTSDEHYHIRNKRLTNVSAPIDNSDATTKKFVTDLLKTKAGTTYVNNELAALKKRVKVLESTVDKLQKAVDFMQNNCRNAFPNKFNASQTMRGRLMTFLK